MKLRDRYRRLNLWSKISLWGSVVSLLGPVLWFLPHRPDSPMVVQTMTNSPNSVQIVTEHLHVIYASKLPKPGLRVAPVSENVPIRDYFLTEVEIEVLSPYPLPNLYLVAHAPSILGMQATPMRTGAFITGHSGHRTGYAFTNLPNISGTFRLQLKSEQPETFRIEVSVT